VEGGLDNVPEIAAARDLVYLIQELNVNASGEVPNFTATNFPLSGRRLLVNGEVQPTLKAFSGEVIRLRLINGSVRTNIPFAIDDHEVHVASLDGITVPTLRTAPSVFMAPAGRSDILVRCQGVGLHAIKKLADANNPNVDAEVILGFLEVLPEEVTMDLPTNLPVPPELTDITAGEVTVTRNIKFSISPNGGPPGFSAFTINDKLFSKNDVLDINLNAVEQWNLTNDSTTGHPFHIHVNPFQVISINGVALNPPEWRDTVLIPKGGNVVIRHRFTAFTGLYVFHCHILPHEDLGMMQIVNVI
jgi:FtsP/CotA-like multicopper oxidase with cupredoxin domain